MSNAITALQNDMVRVVGNLPATDAYLSPHFGELQPYQKHSSDNHQLMANSIGLCMEGLRFVAWWVATLQQLVGVQPTFRGDMAGWMGREFLSRIYVLEHAIPIMIVRWWARKNGNRTLVDLCDAWLKTFWTAVHLTIIMGTRPKNTFAPGENFYPGSVWFGARSYEQAKHHLDFWHASWFFHMAIIGNANVPQWVKAGWVWGFVQTIRVGDPNWHGHMGAVEYRKDGRLEISHLLPVRSTVHIIAKNSGKELYHENVQRLSNATAPGYASTLDKRTGEQRYLTADSGGRHHTTISLGTCSLENGHFVAKRKHGAPAVEGSLGHPAGSGKIPALPGSPIWEVIWGPEGAYYADEAPGAPGPGPVPPGENKWVRVRKESIARLASIQSPDRDSVEAAWWDIGGLINETKKI